MLNESELARRAAAVEDAWREANDRFVNELRALRARITDDEEFWVEARTLRQQRGQDFWVILEAAYDAADAAHTAAVEAAHERRLIDAAFDADAAYEAADAAYAKAYAAIAARAP